MLPVRDHTRFQAFAALEPIFTGTHTCFVKELLSTRTLRFTVHLVGLIVAWKPFPKLHCALNMLTVNCLALDYTRKINTCKRTKLKYIVYDIKYF